MLDRPVAALPDTAIAPSCAQEAVLFAPPRELRRCETKELVGQLSEYDGEVLSRLTADEELTLQLFTVDTPIVVENGNQRAKVTVAFLQAILYGPRRCYDDVGAFITQCGYYLEDPVACDRNVPYMNPQCLFSLQGRPPMTFELPKMPQDSVDELSRTSCDILAGFETTAWLDEAVTPTALRTILKPYV